MAKGFNSVCRIHSQHGCRKAIFKEAADALVQSRAHLMLQTRTRVLDGTLKSKFQSWYPGLFKAANTNQEIEQAAA